MAGHPATCGRSGEVDASDLELRLSVVLISYSWAGTIISRINFTLLVICLVRSGAQFASTVHRPFHQKQDIFP